MPWLLEVNSSRTPFGLIPCSLQSCFQNSAPTTFLREYSDSRTVQSEWWWFILAWFKSYYEPIQIWPNKAWFRGKRKGNHIKFLSFSPRTEPYLRLSYLTAFWSHCCSCRPFPLEGCWSDFTPFSSLSSAWERISGNRWFLNLSRNPPLIIYSHSQEIFFPTRALTNFGCRLSAFICASSLTTDGSASSETLLGWKSLYRFTVWWSRIVFLDRPRFLPFWCRSTDLWEGLRSCDSRTRFPRSCFASFSIFWTSTCWGFPAFSPSNTRPGRSLSQKSLSSPWPGSFLNKKILTVELNVLPKHVQQYRCQSFGLQFRTVWLTLILYVSKGYRAQTVYMGDRFLSIIGQILFDFSRVGRLGHFWSLFPDDWIYLSPSVLLFWGSNNLLRWQLIFPNSL